MLNVERWKRKLGKMGFEGSVNAWPDSQGNDLSIEAIPESRYLRPVQVVFRIGAADERKAKDLLRDFSLALDSVLDEAREQVLCCQSR